MNDWWLVIRHAVWIAGAAVLVAAWSHYRVVGFGGRWPLISSAGGFLFCAGFALVTPWWQAIAWVALACFAAAEAWRSLRWHRKAM